MVGVGEIFMHIQYFFMCILVGISSAGLRRVHVGVYFLVIRKGSRHLCFNAVTKYMIISEK